MKKEVIIAIVLGFGLGLVITFGIWSTYQNIQKTTATPTPTIIPTTTESVSEEPTPITTKLEISVDSPANNSIFSNEEILLSGSVTKESVIVVFYEEGEKIIETDNKKFETEISLVGGANRIRIKAFDEDDNETEKTIEVIYSTAQI
jgi:hypothetical protein